jgi:hypothetical protein
MDGARRRCGAFPPIRQLRFGRPAGSARLIALLILGALARIATSLILISISERRSSGYYRESLQALAAAETGLSFAKREIQDMTAEMGDDDSDGRPDFTDGDTLSWGGSYQLIAEASDVAGSGIAAYRANGYTIVAEGNVNGAVRRVRAEIVHDSFLKYARFIAVTGTSYACGAVLTGEVYAGGDLGVPSDCEGDAVQFLEFVATVGDIPNAGYATFYRGYVTGATPLDLGNSVDFDAIRSRAIEFALMPFIRISAGSRHSSCGGICPGPYCKPPRVLSETSFCFK